MYIRERVSPNCSEAVFRFYTTDPKDIKEIAEGIQRATLKTYRKDGVPPDEIKEYFREVLLFNDLSSYDKLAITDGEILVDNESSFIIRTRHDGPKRNKEWTEYIKKNNIIVEDAVHSDDLRKYARDCVNSIDYWDDYEGVIEHPLSELELKTKEVLENDNR